MRRPPGEIPGAFFLPQGRPHFLGVHPRSELCYLKIMHNKSHTFPRSPQNRWVKCMSSQGSIRGVAIQATDLVRDLATLHGKTGRSAQALGEAVMGALLLASTAKGNERLNLNIQGSGLIRQALVDAYPDGKVRGYALERTSFNPDLGEALVDGQVMGPWGMGLLSVLRTKIGELEKPYIGTVPLVTGHLAKDLTFYWLQSEQIPSAVGLAVTLENGIVKSAGGFLVQALTGASAEEIQAVEDNIQHLESLASQLSAEADPVALLSRIFDNAAFTLLEERVLEFSCSCSWERVNRALSLIGAVELQSMLDREGFASIQCDFCTSDYRLERQKLQELLDQVKKASE